MASGFEANSRKVFALWELGLEEHGSLGKLAGTDSAASQLVVEAVGIYADAGSTAQSSTAPWLRCSRSCSSKMARIRASTAGSLWKRKTRRAMRRVVWVNYTQLG